MPTQIITTDDLREFKQELLSEIKSMIEKKSANAIQKKWLRTKEVLNLLGISTNTLTMLRVTGKLPFTKIGGTLYFDYDDIKTMMAQKS